MAFSFDTKDSIIAVTVDILGPNRREKFRFALDTGATQSAVSLEKLKLLGFPERDQDAGTVPLATGSGTVNVHEYELPYIDTLGRSFIDFPVLGAAIPEKASFDGVLGLDFFRDKILTIDFRNGTIDLQ